MSPLRKLITGSLLLICALTVTWWIYQRYKYERKLEALLANNAMSFLLADKLQAAGRSADAKAVCYKQAAETYKVLVGKADGHPDVKLFINALERDGRFQKHTIDAKDTPNRTEQN